LPSYVRRRLLNLREFAAAELDELRRHEPAFGLAIIEEVRALIPFDDYAFIGLDLDGEQTGRELLLATSLDKAAFEGFAASGLTEADPLYRALSPQQPVVAWSDLADNDTGPGRAAQIDAFMERGPMAPRTLFSFWNEAGGLRGIAMFTRQKPFEDFERAVLLWMSERIHAELAEPVLRAFNAQIGLSATEQSSLELASRGMTSEQIAAELGLQPDSVNSAMKLATRKIGANNRTQAVADAIRLGIIK
jgi:DNA-binding CsgD family transcriptional regulator